MDEPNEMTPDDVMGQLFTKLRQPREKATEEVNWLLVSVAQEARAELEQSEMDTESWEMTLERRQAELDNEPSTGYGLEERREELENSARSLRAEQAKARARYDARRSVFAQMLAEVRQSGRVLLQDRTLDEIQALNQGNFLGEALEMDPKRFLEYYGRNTLPAQTPAAPVHEVTELDLARSEGIDYSRAPEPAVEPAYARGREALPQGIVPAQREGLVRSGSASRRDPAAPVRPSPLRHIEPQIPDEPEHDAAAGFDL